jgi:hypothetical protein
MVYNQCLSELIQRRDKINAEIRKMRIVRLRKYTTNNKLTKDINDVLHTINYKWSCCDNSVITCLLIKQIDDLLDYCESKLNLEDDM